MVKRAVFIVAGLILLTASPARAACSVSVTGVAFGTYNVFNAAPVASTGTISYSCGFLENLFQIPIVIRINAGQSGSYGARTMRKGSESLSYNIYTDASGTQIWGDGSGGTDRFEGRASFNPQPLTMFGIMPPGQDVSAGNYSDTLTVTIQF